MKQLLKNNKGEGYIDTGVKIIIAVVIGAVVLGGLYLLFANVIMPQANDDIGGMMEYGEDGTTVRRILNEQSGTYQLQYSYDGKNWLSSTVPNYGSGSSVYGLVAEAGDNPTSYAALVRNGNQYYLLASTDGIKWSERFSFTAQDIPHFYYGNSSQLPSGAGTFTGNKFVLRWHTGGQTYFTAVATNATEMKKPTWSDLILMG